MSGRDRRDPASAGTAARVPVRRLVTRTSRGAALTASVLLLLGAVAALIQPGLIARSTIPPAAGQPLRIGQVAFRAGHITVSVVNDSDADVDLAQVIVNQAIWGFTTDPGRRVAPGQRVNVGVSYPWLAGERQEVRLVTSFGQTATWNGPATPDPAASAALSDSGVPWEIVGGAAAITGALAWLVRALGWRGPWAAPSLSRSHPA